jgi:poly-gamma-glutamate capsule biosynthesis protein CapA/YwtB (metallophosphatase superfamily)
MVAISFIGDIGLNNGYVDLKSNHVNPFNSLIPSFSGIDLLVGNLECVLKGDKGENYLKRPRLSTTIETLHFLTDIHLGLASLATNHIYDNLEDGFQKTTDFLKDNHIAFLGAGLDKETSNRPYIFSKNNISFCFLNYITPDTNFALPDDAKVYLNEFQLDKCLTELYKHKSYDFRIVLMHWGGRFEGGLYPDFDQIGLAKKLIDHGADLIIGHHSHTLQPYEKYKGKYIFYSLGNFCFSDIKFEGNIRKMSSLRERESVVACVEFSKKQYTVKLIPFRNENLILHIRNFVLLKLRLRNICFHLLRFKPFWSIYKTSFYKLRPLFVQLFRKDENRSLLIRIKDQLFRKK